MQATLQKAKSQLLSLLANHENLSIASFLDGIAIPERKLNSLSLYDILSLLDKSDDDSKKIGWEGILSLYPDLYRKNRLDPCSVVNILKSRLESLQTDESPESSSLIFSLDKLQSQMRASCVIVSSEAFIFNDSGEITALNLLPCKERRLETARGDFFPLPDLPFMDQLTVKNLGSGFFVDSDEGTAKCLTPDECKGYYLLTAGHVMAKIIEREIEYPYIIQNFFLDEEECLAEITIFKSAKSINNHNDLGILFDNASDMDIALIPIDPKPVLHGIITKDNTLKIMSDSWDSSKVSVIKLPSSSVELQCGQSVYTMGFGLGLPLKISWNGFVFNQAGSNLGNCKLETFAGFSGSCVFNHENMEPVGFVISHDVEQNLRIWKNNEYFAYPEVYLHGTYGMKYMKFNKNLLQKINKYLPKRNNNA